MAEGTFPWHLGVFDAHCHPTDTMASLTDIPNMKARVLTVMATRAQDQDLVDEAALNLAAPSLEELDLQGSDQMYRSDSSPLFLSTRPTKIIPCFGWHPWFSHHIFSPRLSSASSLTPEQINEHYRTVVTPTPDDAFISSLPTPRSLSTFLDSTRSHLNSYPLAIIGEIGLDRGFRLPEPWPPDHSSDRSDGLTPGGREGRRLSKCKVSLEHQREVLVAQLNLAGEMGRSVSVHGVQAAGVLYEALRGTWKGWEREVLGRRKKAMVQREERAKAHDLQPADQEDEDGDGKDENSKKPFPPRICLHSYSGPPETIKQYLHPSTPAEIFFSFSTAINFSTDSTKAEDSIKAVPDDRILVESDLHIAGERMDEMLEDIIRRICKLKSWTLDDGVKQLGRNWKRFIFGEDK